MEGKVSDLVAFLNARLNAEEYEVLKFSHDSQWGAEMLASLLGRDESDPIVHHIARHDPARALREVAAKRAILAAHGPDPIDKFGGIAKPRCLVCLAGRDGYEELWVADSWPCLTLRLLAAVYSDHPDYQQEWAP